MFADLRGFTFMKRVKFEITEKSFPIVSFFTAVTDSFGSAKQAADFWFHQTRQIKNLKQINGRLMKWKAAALSSEFENQALRSYLTTPDAGKPYTTIAKIISVVDTPGKNRLFIHAGRTEDITIDSAVLSHRGLIGRIINVGEKVSEVLMLTDPLSRIPVALHPDSGHAIVGGQSHHLLSIDNRTGNNQLKAGISVMTSGHGGIYPAGLYLGKVIRKNDVDELMPSFQNDDLQFVMIQRNTNNRERVS